jgi:hypothetical protein
VPQSARDALRQLAVGHLDPAIIERLLGKEHPDVGTTLKNLAELYRDEGRGDEAEPLYQRAVAILEKALGASHPEVVETRTGYARIAVQSSE